MQPVSEEAFQPDADTLDSLPRRSGGVASASSRRSSSFATGLPDDELSFLRHADARQAQGTSQPSSSSSAPESAHCATGSCDELYNTASRPVSFSPGQGPGDYCRREEHHPEATLHSAAQFGTTGKTRDVDSSSSSAKPSHDELTGSIHAGSGRRLSLLLEALAEGQQAVAQGESSVDEDNQVPTTPEQQTEPFAPLQDPPGLDAFLEEFDDYELDDEERAELAAELEKARLMSLEQEEETPADGETGDHAADSTEPFQPSEGDGSFRHDEAAELGEASSEEAEPENIPGQVLLDIVQQAHPDVHCMEAVLDAGAPADVRDKDGNTPLMLVATKPRVKPVTLLLNARANVDACNFLGETSLQLAARSRNAVVVGCLLKNSADANLKDGYGESSLTEAVLTRDVGVLKVLLHFRAHIGDEFRGKPSDVVEGFNLEQSPEILKILCQSLTGQGLQDLHPTSDQCSEASAKQDPPDFGPTMDQCSEAATSSKTYASRRKQERDRERQAILEQHRLDRAEFSVRKTDCPQLSKSSQRLQDRVSSPEPRIAQLGDYGFSREDARQKKAFKGPGQPVGGTPCPDLEGGSSDALRAKMAAAAEARKESSLMHSGCSTSMPSNDCGQDLLGIVPDTAEQQEKTQQGPSAVSSECSGGFGTVHSKEPGDDAENRSADEPLATQSSPVVQDKSDINTQANVDGTTEASSKSDTWCGENHTSSAEIKSNTGQQRTAIQHSSSAYEPKKHPTACAESAFFRWKGNFKQADASIAQDGHPSKMRAATLNGLTGVLCRVDSARTSGSAIIMFDCVESPAAAGYASALVRHLSKTNEQPVLEDSSLIEEVQPQGNEMIVQSVLQTVGNLVRYLQPPAKCKKQTLLVGIGFAAAPVLAHASRLCKEALSAVALLIGPSHTCWGTPQPVWPMAPRLLLLHSNAEGASDPVSALRQALPRDASLCVRVLRVRPMKRADTSSDDDDELPGNKAPATSTSAVRDTGAAKVQQPCVTTGAAASCSEKTKPEPDQKSEVHHEEQDLLSLSSLSQIGAHQTAGVVNGTSEAAQQNPQCAVPPEQPKCDLRSRISPEQRRLALQRAQQRKSKGVTPPSPKSQKCVFFFMGDDDDDSGHAGSKENCKSAPPACPQQPASMSPAAEEMHVPHQQVECSEDQDSSPSCGLPDSMRAARAIMQFLAQPLQTP